MGRMQGKGSILGVKAPDFNLPDQNGKIWGLSDAIAQRSCLMVFYPGDFTPVCTKQLCTYRDALPVFEEMGIQLLGLSSNTIESHVKFSREYGFNFPLLSDMRRDVAKSYGCTSIFMFGAVSRAICIVNMKGILLYRYVEPTVWTHRRTHELVGIVHDLKENNLI